MSDDDNNQHDEQPEDEKQEEALSPEEEKLNKYYNRLPKLIKHITNGNAERHNALDRLLRTFEQINELQHQMGIIDSDVDLGTIFEMAVNGGGAVDIDELREANEAFAEENEILASAVETLGFQLKTVRGQAADEIIETGLIDKNAVRRLKGSIESVQSLITTLEKFTAENVISSEDITDENGKRFDERLTEEILDLDKVDLDNIAKTAKQKPSLAGRVMQKLGTSTGYDNSDAYATRQLLIATLQVNREQNEVIESLRPMHDQLEKIHKIIELIELIESTEERQDKAYQEALEQIELLNAQVEKFQSKYAEFSELERQVETAESDLKTLTRKIEEGTRELEELEGKLEQRRKAEKEKPDEPSFNKLETPEVEFHLMDEGVFGSEAEEIAHLKKRLKNAHKLQVQNSQELGALRDRLRHSGDALFIQKLQKEIGVLKRNISAEIERTEEAEKERLAIEERIPRWVKEQPNMQDQFTQWRRKNVTSISSIYVAGPALATTAAFAGYLTHSFMTASIGIGALTTAWALGTLVPAAIGAVSFGLYKVNQEKKPQKKKSTFLRNSFIGAVMGASIGAAVTSLSFTGFQNYFEGQKETTTEETSPNTPNTPPHQPIIR
jgi:hypothetical protein